MLRIYIYNLAAFYLKFKMSHLQNNIVELDVWRCLLFLTCKLIAYLMSNCMQTCYSFQSKIGMQSYPKI